MKDGIGLAGKLAKFFIDSKLTPLVIVASILLGLGAVLLLPREEEPQIVVPMIDVFVQMPGASSREVEERVTKRTSQVKGRRQRAHGLDVGPSSFPALQRTHGMDRQARNRGELFLGEACGLA